MEVSIEISQKTTKIEIPLNLALHFLVVLLKELKYIML